MKKNLSMFLLCISFGLFSGTASSSDYAIDNSGSPMAEAMWDMMDWMRGEQNNAAMPFPGMGGFPGLKSMPGMDIDSMPMMKQFRGGEQSNPWSQMSKGIPFADQWDQFTNPDQRNLHEPKNQAELPVSHRLDGVWKGQSGEFFMIKGDRFRLASSNGQSLDGRISIIGDRMQTYLPVTEQIRQYQFVKIGEMMMMRDETGQTLVFNRLQR